MNISVKLKLYNLQNTGKNLQILKSNLSSLDIDHIAEGFYAFILDDLCVKLIKKGLAAKKDNFNFIMSPAAAYVIYELWFLLPHNIYPDLPLHRKIINEIDRCGIKYINPFNSTF